MPLTPLNTNAFTGQALITLVYDDGERSNFDIALPLHLQFNIAAGFAIVAERPLNSKFHSRYMDHTQVAEAARQGVEIYSHSLSHPRLTLVDEARLDLELRESRKILEEIISPSQDGKVTTICIPFSASDARIIAAAQQHYSHIRVKGDRFTPLRAEANPHLVYSFGLKNHTAFEDVKTLIDRAVDKKAWLTIMLHGTVPESRPATREYEISATLLRKILGYINEQGRAQLLPANISEVAKIRAGLG